jgi:glutaryl-CoA dehydrogenase
LVPRCRSPGSPPKAGSASRTAVPPRASTGITLDYPPLGHADNLESVLTCEGTSEVHTLVIGEALTGLSAYR